MVRTSRDGVEDAVLSRLFAQSGDELFPRFAASYEELRALPRRTRRALQRRLARSCELTRLVKDRMQAHPGRALQHKLAWSLAAPPYCWRWVKMFTRRISP